MGTTYPVRVDGLLDDRLNRWLWLVKWVLVIPHLLVLALLWVAFAVLSIVAFFAILFTGRYPRGIFDFNVGVMRWTWRVAFYAYGALGTDKYPPFTLADVPDYPAHLHVTYPERLSRGLVLVKWWLLAIPHYLVVGFFIGGGTWFAANAGVDTWAWGAGLVGLLVLTAAVVLLFTGRYPRSIFDLVLGMQRWVLRVAAYASLMVDEYPPFRLDMGGDDPGTTQLGPPPASGTPAESPGSAAPQRPQQAPTSQWSAGRVITTVLGTAVALASAFGLAVGGTMLWLDQTQRDGAGYLTSDTVSLRTTGYALVSENLTIDTGAATEVPRRLIGDARVRVEAAGDGPVFIGVARSGDVRNYLAGVDYSTVRSYGPDGTNYSDHTGTAPTSAPNDATIWRTQASGTGVQTITWGVESGDWTIVVMSPDGTAGIDVRLDVGATAPALDWLSIAVLISAGAFFVLGVLAVALAVPRTRRVTS